MASERAFTRWQKEYRRWHGRKPSKQEIAAVRSEGPEGAETLADIYAMRRSEPPGLFLYDAILDAQRGKPERLEGHLQRHHPSSDGSMAKALTAAMMGKIKRRPGPPTMAERGLSDRERKLRRAVDSLEAIKQTMRARGDTLYGMHDRLRDEQLAAAGLDPAADALAFDNLWHRSTKTKRPKQRTVP